jgi:hypothetical protein
MRTMSVMAQDPSVRIGNNGRGAILMSTVSVPAEDLIPGPMGYRVQVVDFDASTGSFSGAHELPASFDDEPAAWRRGDQGLVGDFRFHAQNVYALVMKTLARFELALGRRVSWSFDAHQLKVAPHGMFDANAFYSPQSEGLVFGYVMGRDGRPIYTCLSHDVVVHETAHALIDGLRERYLDPSSPDQAALHEGLADVIALLSVFSQRELLHQLLARATGADGSSPLIDRAELTPDKLRASALFGLAEEIGEEIQGMRGHALRHSADLAPRPGLLDEPEFLEAHRRGEVLVAAVMNGFIQTWAARALQLGIPGQKQFPRAKVAEEGASIADALATMWIRALDYMPPVHVEFPDALSAALTADQEVRPDDSLLQLREHMLRSFRSYGIRPPKQTRGDGTWEPAPADLSYDRVRFESMRSDRDEVFRFIWDNREQLELRQGAYTKVLSVRPCTRVGVDGFTLRETVAEYYQVARLTGAELQESGVKAPRAYLQALRAARKQRRRRGNGAALDANGKPPAPPEPEADDESTTPLHGGGTLIFDEYGRLKYHVHNDVFGRRQAQRLSYLWNTGQLRPGADRARLTAARLSTIHRLRALDARKFPQEGW